MSAGGGKKRQLGLDSFFTKRSKVPDNNELDVVECDTEDNASADDFDRSKIDQSKTATSSASAAGNGDGLALDTLTKYKGRDFGHFCSNQAAVALLTDEEKYQLVKNSWTPSTDYKFPLVPEGNKNRSFQRSWLQTYEWLTYRKEKNGALCKICVLFGRCEGGIIDVKLGKLVCEPMTTYKKAVELLKHHSNTDYHKRNMFAYHNFLMIHENKAVDVVSSMCRAETQTIEGNRKKLIPIIKTVILCGAQNIPLRGHRDDGAITDTDGCSFGEGNFRALLKFRMDAGDEVLASHLKSCGNNASYISKTTQNDIIECCGEVITEKIVKNTNDSKFFTIMADETTDISLKEQLTICIRYFNTKECSIKEDFIKFVDVVDLTGENLAHVILQELEKLNLDITDCRGQAFDGCSNMSGIFKGVQARIAQIQPLATYSHCPNHRLNLALSKACTVPSIRNAVGLISSLANFFRDSASRFKRLQDEMRENHNLKPQKHGLKKMCETRWLERHEAVLTFIENLPALPTVLETISNSPDGRGSNAFPLLNSIMTSEFLISVVVLSDVLGVTLPLARKLQAEYMDVLNAMQLVKATIASIQEKRDNSETSFKELFEKSTELAGEMGTEIQKPRIAKVQNNRSNVQIDSVEDYYRTTVFIPFLDFILNELTTRFPKNEMQCVGKLQMLLSSNFEKNDKTAILEGAFLYKDDLPCFSALGGELEIWKHIWQTLPEKERPKHPAQAYKLADALPNVRMLLQLLCTLPVTTSTAERSFSALRCLKTYMRSTMMEDRLNRLALLHIHQDISSGLKAEEVLEVFARKCKMKLTLIHL